MTFYQKIRAHEGGLVRLNVPGNSSAGFLSGKTGMVCSVDVWKLGPRDRAAKVTLFIDGKVHTVFLFEKEVQFL